jgi:hypothetical protein
LVVSVTPASLITATFNKAMNPTSPNTSPLTVTGPSRASITGSAAYSGMTASFTPATLLAASSTYTATTGGALVPAYTAIISTTAKSSARQRSGSKLRFHFYYRCDR